MSRDLDCPVQTQMAVAVLDRSFSSEYPASSKTEGRPLSWKRVFVQTDNGSVLGIELERGENAQSVKKKLQIALNVSTEESSLTFGDLVLNNDLSNVRNDSPLLLTRNQMHRSSSTPCLSPNGSGVQQRDRSGPIAILGCSSPSPEMKQLAKDIVKAIRNDVDPVAVNSGMGGAYYFDNIWGEHVAIVKPTDEEPFAPNNPKGFVGKTLGQPGLKRSVRVGETGFREVAAYLLDHGNFAKVPPTMLVKITHTVFNVNATVGCNHKVFHNNSQPVSKIASLQQFIPHDFDASDHGTSSFPVSAVHRIGILDIRIFNTDRHSGNLLVRKVGPGSDNFGVQTELIPIDHGLCLPECLEDPYFEWIHWPQASIPFSEEELEYIANLDPVKDADMLRMELPMIRKACLRVLVLSTIFLKEGAAFGLCLSEIGEMMSRQFTGKEEEPSELELLCMEARKWVEDRELFLPEAGVEDDDDDFTQFSLDGEDDSDAFESPSFSRFGPMKASHRNPLSKLAECDEEEDDDKEMVKDDSDPLNAKPYRGGIPKTKSKVAAKTNYSGEGSMYQSGSRSANEMLPPSASFVKLSDMGSEEWTAFLDKFQELLPSAFRARKHAAGSGPRPLQRLGTSCQF
ncbi:phosphatidylinositol 4-kinase gamma 7-like isoform X2 [Triticum dicoccoides]|uniref:phosphatidylinositol 4-kinase gamma 7-like isoform X2 n=1 Tax=Triticum dicoccoides TaxID=85692 RepID=UPI00084501B2|nr:phosphatidylinositol 4-kinase gamma 7-like isoform X2 [Triticum dicoccoides]XP_044381721.1 phosphatidylinositol 4-kinase gamma 7-like isoform X2 [Triticum aestivum]